MNSKLWVIITFMHYSAVHAMEVQVIADFRKNYQALNAQDVKGRTLLHYACKQRHLDDVQELLAAGVKTDIADNYGNTPLHLICNVYQGRKRKLRIIEELIKAGAPVNATNRWLQTPLHAATSCSYRAVIRLLLRHGALLNVEDHAGATPLDHAVVLGASTENIKLLLDAGAAITGNTIGMASGQSLQWQYPQTLGNTLFHQDIASLDPSFPLLIQYPRSMTKQDRAIAFTVLLIHRMRKNSLLATVPKDVLMSHILPHCVRNFYYAYGTVRQQVNWHIAELERFFSQKNSAGLLPYQTQNDRCQMMMPEKINELHRKEIERNYKKQRLLKLSRMIAKFGHGT